MIRNVGRVATARKMQPKLLTSITGLYLWYGLGYGFGLGGLGMD